MWDATKDFMNAFLGAFTLLLSLVFIPEIKRKNKYVVGIVILIGILTWLGFDKIGRDNRKDALNEQRRADDSVKFQKLLFKLDTLSNNYKSDTSRFSDFKKKLETDFHITDSANKPIRVETPLYVNGSIKKSQKNYQRIDSGGSGIQNNAPNYGNQAGRDQYITTEKQLTEEEKKSLLSQIQAVLRQNNINCIGLFISSGSNGGKVYQQLKETLISNGYKIGAEGQSVAPSRGITYNIVLRCLQITIGSF